MVENSDEESELKEVKISDIKDKFIKEEKETNLKIYKWKARNLTKTKVKI